MLIKCEVPLPSTPDVFDIYSSSIDPTGIPTETPLETTTDVLITTTEATLEPTTADSLHYEISTNCTFDEDGNSAVFDTGLPYSNNMRPGYI